MELEKIKSVLKYLDRLSWKSDITDEIIIEIAKRHFKTISKKKTKSKNILRLVGQSGSGKTSQLLPAGNVWFQKKALKPIHFCVRNFAALHPNYNVLLKEFGKDEIREKTNGFALKCLVISLLLAISKGYDVLFEMTLLTPKFEKFLFDYLSQNGYDIKILALCVSKKLSNSFIEKRKLSKGCESGRKVYNSSTKFFNKNLCLSFRFLSIIFPKIQVILWNHYSLLPIFQGEISSSIEAFFKSRKLYRNGVLSEEQLKQAKCDFMKKVF